jgi:glycosyltransferase involved in cell wall biosynthesis
MSELDIAHLHTIDQAGGGAKIVRKLHTELTNSSKFDSRLFVGNKQTNREDIIEIGSSDIETRVTNFLERILSLDGLGSPSSFLHRKKIKNYSPDIIHLHNLHGQYFNFLNIGYLSDICPVVWTFHDMWPMTGRCAYSYDCDKYTDTCHDCPYLDTAKSVEFDSTMLLHKLKKNIFKRADANIIAPSQWMEENVRESFFNTDNLYRIPYGIDTDFFSPIHDQKRRRLSDIRNDSIVILFIANGLSNPRKGMKHLLTALSNIPEKDDISLLVVGGEDLPESRIPEQLDLHVPGYIENNELPVAYSTADVTVVPSLYESFGLVATESMSCGTPVVSYKTSGLQEQITDSTGWLAEFMNIRSLTENIREAVTDEEQRQRKGKNARKRVVQNYNQQRFIDDHKRLYSRIASD